MGARGSVMTNAPLLSRAGKDGVIQDTGKPIQNHSPTELEDTGGARVLMFMGLYNQGRHSGAERVDFPGIEGCEIKSSTYSIENKRP